MEDLILVTKENYNDLDKSMQTLILLNWLNQYTKIIIKQNGDLVATQKDISLIDLSDILTEQESKIATELFDNDNKIKTKYINKV